MLTRSEYRAFVIAYEALAELHDRVEQVVPDGMLTYPPEEDHRERAADARYWADRYRFVAEES